MGKVVGAFIPKKPKSKPCPECGKLITVLSAMCTKCHRRKEAQQNGLLDRAKEIVALRQQGWKPVDIGLQYNISRERVRQIVKKAMTP